VLISQQSTSELQRSLQQLTYRALAVALSPQSVASLAAYYGLGPVQTYVCLRALFRSYVEQIARATGTTPIPVYLYSTAAASDLSLIESAAEFVAR
jgi:iron only hydrogenase large subunit-like protein